MQFEYGWFADPITFGKYPDVMVDLITDNRLPTFTDEEKALITGSYDFLGINHYTSKYVKYTGVVGRDWGNDGRYENLAENINGELIGPFAESGWLNVYPDGIR